MTASAGFTEFDPAFKGVRISGRVVHAETGNPLVGAELYAMLTPTVIGEIPYQNADLLTDADGRFVFSKLSARNYILLSRSGRIANPNSAEVTGGIQISSGQTKEIQVRLEPYRGASVIEARKSASRQ